MAGAGNPGAGSAGSTGFNAYPAPTYYLHGMYVQDDWKARRKLTLNLGFRYEIQMPPTARHNEQAYFDLHALNPISAATGIPVYGQIVYNNPGNRSLYNHNLNDFAPRVGFAYAVMPKLVLRGGYGIYYARNFYGGNGPDPGYSTSASVDFLGRRDPRDRPACPGIPVGTGAGYRELVSRSDPSGSEPKCRESASPRSDDPAVQLWIPIRLHSQRCAWTSITWEAAEGASPSAA